MAHDSSTQALPLTGRKRELAFLTALIEDTRATGQGRVVIVSGETGIGKTRLVREALTEARARSFCVLSGRAFPLAAGLAYAPILDAIAPFLRALDLPARGALTRGLPDLGTLFSGLGLSPPEPLHDPALEKTRLFEAVRRLIERIAADQPVVFFIDDLHWADPASIELLHYLAQRVVDAPVCVLATYRAEDVDQARGLRPLLAALRRTAVLEELTLDRLGPDEVSALIESLLGQEVAPQIPATLGERARGVPLFVEALVRGARDTGDLVLEGGTWNLSSNTSPTLPPNVRDAITERLARLDPDARRLVDLIAASGQEAHYSTLRKVGDFDHETLNHSLSRLRSAGLVSEQDSKSEVRYAFTHPLIQEAANTELSAVRRRQLHAAFAQVLERGDFDAVEQLAYHYRLAGREVDADRAVEVLVAAGDHARELSANDEAAQYFGAALELVRSGHQADRMPEVLEKLGEAWERVGEAAAAVSVWSEALTDRQRASDGRTVARLQRRLALAEWDRGHFEPALAHLNDGLEALPSDDISEERADLLHDRLVIAGRLRDQEVLQTTAAELESVAHALNSSRALAEVHLSKLAARWQRMDFSGALDELRQGLEQAQRGNAALLAGRAHDLLALVHHALGNHTQGRTHALASLTLAEDLGAPTLALYPRNRMAYFAIMSGDWESAAGISAESLTAARRLEHPRGIAGCLGTRAFVHAHLGELEEAEACLAEGREIFFASETTDQNILSQIQVAELVLALERETWDAAVHAADQLDPGSSQLGLIPTFCFGLIAEARLQTGRSDGTLENLNQMVEHAPPDNHFLPALAKRVEGLVCRAEGDLEDAAACLGQAAQLFTEAALPFEGARARFEYAKIVAASNPENSSRTAQESLTTFEQLGARRYAQRARRLLLDLGVRPARRARARRKGGPLSPRELDVVRLVAEDLTAAEIAERLFISPRTVTTHLDRIYTRLGVNSRASLVRYALESGLLRTGADSVASGSRRPLPRIT